MSAYPPGTTAADIESRFGESPATTCCTCGGKFDADDGEGRCAECDQERQEFMSAWRSGNAASPRHALRGVGNQTAIQGSIPCALNNFPVPVLAEPYHCPLDAHLSVDLLGKGEARESNHDGVACCHWPSGRNRAFAAGNNFVKQQEQQQTT